MRYYNDEFISMKENYAMMERVEQNCEQLQLLESLDMYSKIPIFEMASYYPEDSGLHYIIWFDEAHNERNVSHNIPRFKFGPDVKHLIPASIEKKPKILLKGTRLTKAENILKEKYTKEVFDFISKNVDIILKHWNGQITTKQLFNSLENL